MYMYNWVTLLYSRNTILQINYTPIKKIFKKKEMWLKKKVSTDTCNSLGES